MLASNFHKQALYRAIILFDNYQLLLSVRLIINLSNSLSWLLPGAAE